MDTYIKFRISIVDIPEGTTKEARDAAISATTIDFIEYENAQMMLKTLTVGVYRITKQYHNELS